MEDAPVSVLLEGDTVLTAEHMKEGIVNEQEWWVSFLQSFLTASASYFSKPYTVQHLQRILSHLPHHRPASSTYPASSPLLRICCVPLMLELIGGHLLVHWRYEVYSVQIDIPDENDPSLQGSIPPVKDEEPIVSIVLPAPSAEMEEWDADAVPEEQATEILDNPAMLLEKQRVKEARLRAKLAVYRAQYQMNRFQDKYGQEVSDSESEEDENEDEDEEDQSSFS